MNRGFIKAILTCTALVTMVHSSITGKIVDEQGEPIKGVTIATTDADTVKSDSLGNFTLYFQGESVLQSNQTGGYTLNQTRGQLQLSLSTSRKVSLTMTDLRGRATKIFSGELQQGVHALPLPRNMATGVRVLRGSIGDDSFSRKILVSSNAVSTDMLIGGSSTVLREHTTPITSRGSHSVTFAKKGYFTDTISADNNSEMGIITMKKPEGWEFESHDKGASANYALLFPDSAVNRIDITISETDWHAMLDDMTARYGTFNPRWSGDPNAYIGNPVGGLTENPIYVPATVEFKGKKWTKVGMRFKGNGTLQNAWNGGSYKMPFKLDFDEFEEDYPEINDQRFYGVRQMALYNHSYDYTCLREKFVGDRFRAAGIAAPHRSYYEVHIDFGSGPYYFGLYTAVEIPWGEFMKNSFGETVEEGNIYKPEPPIGNEELRKAAKFQDNAILSEETFAKKNNKSSDWSDIQAILDVLHSSERTSNPASWRSNLETVFNVDGFLNYMAGITAMKAHDSYGGAPHNYYLYGDPNSAGKINWIAYDLNDALAPMAHPIDLDMSNVTDEWPLIRFLMDDSVYNDVYWQHLRSFSENQFQEAEVLAELTRLQNMIKPYVTSEVANYSTFSPAGPNTSELNFDWFDGYMYDELKSTVTTRTAEVKAAVSNR